MNRLLIFILMFFGATMVSAQDFRCTWISALEVDSTSQVWFQRTYIMSRRPAQANICVVTTGYCELFVNGYNVSKRVLTPHRLPMSDNPVAMTFDVSRFLRKDTNTVAVHYSPSYPHINNRQIAVLFYGSDVTDTPFSFVSDGSWLCRLANGRLTDDGGEVIDRNAYRLNWKYKDVDLACWAPAVEHFSDCATIIPSSTSRYEGERVVRISRFKYYDVIGDSVVYDFGNGFHGQLRVTLRGCKAGEKINIDGLEYTCSGEMDEQACRRFTTSYIRRAIICGDKNFRREQIQNVEAIEIASVSERL